MENSAFLAPSLRLKSTLVLREMENVGFGFPILRHSTEVTPLFSRSRWAQFETPVAARLCYPPSSRNRPLSWEKSYGLGTK